MLIECKKTKGKQEKNNVSRNGIKFQWGNNISELLCLHDIRTREVLKMISARLSSWNQDDLLL